VVGVELSDGTHPDPREVFVVHANAPLSERGRLRLARLIVEQGWPIARAAERMQVAWPTAKRWAERYRAEGAQGMVDRSSRPHRSPRTTPTPVVRRIVHLRWKQRLGPVAIAAAVGCSPSTATRSCAAAGSTGWAMLTGPPVSPCAAMNIPFPAICSTSMSRS
jgi:leucine-zipper of insertion element IS481